MLKMSVSESVHIDEVMRPISLHSFDGMTVNDLVSTGITAGNIGTLFTISAQDVYFGEGTGLFGTSDTRISGELFLYL